MGGGSIIPPSPPKKESPTQNKHLLLLLYVYIESTKSQFFWGFQRQKLTGKYFLLYFQEN
jgi:hypothetical protein